MGECQRGWEKPDGTGIHSEQRKRHAEATWPVACHGGLSVYGQSLEKSYGVWWERRKGISVLWKRPESVHNCIIIRAEGRRSAGSDGRGRTCTHAQKARIQNSNTVLLHIDCLSSVQLFVSFDRLSCRRQRRRHGGHGRRAEMGMGRARIACDSAADM